MDKPQILRLNEGDNIIVAITDLAPGALVEGGIRTARRIPRGALAPGLFELRIARRHQQLTALGNGVLPLQAVSALSLLAA